MRDAYIHFLHSHGGGDGEAICTASDAHTQSDVGANIREFERMLEGIR